MAGSRKNGRKLKFSQVHSDERNQSRHSTVCPGRGDKRPKTDTGSAGITVSEVKGFGRSRGVDAAEKVIEGTTEYARKVKLEIVVADSLVEGVIQVLVTNAHRGKPGDGKIFISTVDDIVKVRTGERGELGI